MTQSVWIDTAYAPDATTAREAAAAVGADSVNLYLGGRFSAGRGWTLELDDQLELAGLGTLLTWVSLEPGQGGYDVGHQDGLDAVAAAQGWVAWGLNYDVEPDTWKAWPAGVIEAMAGFRDAVHAAGWRAVAYGLPETINQGAAGCDGAWIANPGVTDPAAAGVPGFVGSRSVQGGQAVLAGITWDVSYSEFTLRLSAGAGGGMGCNIVIPDPDPAASPALWVFVLDEATHLPAWGLQAGGEGGMDQSTWVNLTTNALGQGQTLRIVPGTMSAWVRPFQGVKRAGISGRSEADGEMYMCVLKAQDDFAVIEPWHKVPCNLKIALPEPDPTGLVTSAAYDAHRHPATTSGTTGAPS